jgi:hypothetical protein
MSDNPLRVLSEQDYDDAFTEVSFLLGMLSGSVHELMGGAGASIGRLAGRRAARKFPLHLPNPDLAGVLAALGAYWADTFEWQSVAREDGADVEYRRCVVREVCHRLQVEPGGELCCLVHHYLDGVVNELLSRRVKSSIETAGPVCRTALEVR